jgi:CubicO group peptidase (beta-lactamase class C family)
MRASRFKLFIAGLLLIAAIPTSANAQSASFDKKKLGTYLNKLLEENKFMGSVAIDSAGQEVYNNSLGFSHLEDQKMKADRETKYRIGSVTKTFTAVMIFQLIEEGKLSLSTTLAEYYPQMPQAGSITIEDMLRHQSGLYNFTNSSDYPKWMTEKRSKKQMLALFEDQEPQFAPGTKTSYSNTNYVLLGFIIEDITGDTYANELEKRITDPLNLENTYYGDGINPEENEAASFRFTDSLWKAMPETDMSVPGGAGAIVSTPDDLTDFMQALFNDKLVSKESKEKMTTIEMRLGMGLMQVPFYNSFAYGHNGGIDGFQSHTTYFPQEDVAVAFTANAMDYHMNNILIGILNIYFGRDFDIPDFDQPTIITLTRKEMQKYIGNYGSDQLPMDIKIFVKDSRLMAQGTGQSAFPLTATDQTTMRFERAGIVMEFDSLSSNKYQQFKLNQSGGSFLFRRK